MGYRSLNINGEKVYGYNNPSGNYRFVFSEEDVNWIKKNLPIIKNGSN